MPPVPHRLRPSHFLKTFCHDQIKLLLERMDSHPEEFLKGSKWDACMPPQMIMHRTVGVISHYRQFNILERHLIKRKLAKMIKELMQQEAYDAILEIIVGNEEKSWTTVGAYTSGTPVLGTPPTGKATAHISASGNLTTNTLTLGNETLDANTIKHLKEHLKAVSAAKRLGRI